ncbi:MAG TPA: YkgJ family cysteine cluster protein [Slackia equolifaciens]|uniref:YkgJ family cysteine cluster protein n=1 Tax=Slackia equolifaciens TaxID=498718 RepID=A0A9D2UX57_9ACTN|nr:YkgJ family cysteine cluster protein [Slackia equolifaciens]
MSAPAACPRSNEVIDIRTWRGSCDGCGECCGRMLPITVEDVARLKAYVRRMGIDPAPESWTEGGELFVNLNCPFLGADRRCMVYDARPAICRAYRCDLHRAGTMTPPEWNETPRIVDMREVFG